MADGTYYRARTLTLTVDGTAGHFSARSVLRHDDASPPDFVGRVRLNVISAPAGFTLIVDQLKPGGDETVSGDWRTDVDESTDTGPLPEQQFLFHQGIGYRGKSGGTAGDIVIDAQFEVR